MGSGAAADAGRLGRAGKIGRLFRLRFFAAAHSYLAGRPAYTENGWPNLQGHRLVGIFPDMIFDASLIIWQAHLA